MNKSNYLTTMKHVNGTLKLTFKFPKVSTLISEEPTRLSIKDTDFAETEVLRQFFINMNRVVPFQFVAYPEDRAFDDDKKFVGLHYHAVVRSENDAKFIAVAKRKYRAVLESAYQRQFANVVMPRDPLWVEHLSRDEPSSYEDYCLKHYQPSIRLITDADFRSKSPLRAA